MRPFEHYLALLSAMIFVVLQHKEKPMLSRLVIAGVSGGMGSALATDAAELTGRSEIIAVVVITAFSYLVLDAVGALISDREAIKEILVRRLGGRK